MTHITVISLFILSLCSSKQASPNVMEFPRVAQTVAQMAPQRVQALVLSAPVYPGFGTRPLEPEAQRERWYQHFHTIAQADQLIGHDRETVRLYLVTIQVPKNQSSRF